MLGQKKQDEDKDKGAAESGADASGRRSKRAGGRDGAVSMVGEGMRVVGDVTGRGGLRVEGTVEGTVETDGNVIVVDGGEVDGDVTASEVVVAGKVSGKIEAEKTARFKSGCHVDAEIRSPAVEVEEGARVNGRIDMTGGGSSGSSSSSGSSGKSFRSDRKKDASKDESGKKAEAKAGSSSGGSGGGKKDS